MEERIRELLAKLTLDEKLHLLHGDFESGGVPRLNIPPLICADGPVGVRMNSQETGAVTGEDGEVQDEGQVETDLVPTAFPSTLGLAATFNTAEAETFGRLLGLEAKAAGVNVMFGPGLNLMRDPRCGRNFEYMGEDPLLTAAIGGAYIRGMQKENVAACAKHYYANDVETRRHQTSSNLDAQTAWEIHLRPFADACSQYGVWTIMTGNHIVNGTHITENRQELHDVVRTRLGWDGVVLTDWRSAYTPEGSVKGGTDMTTGFCQYVYGDEDLRNAVAEGAVSMEEIDTLVSHVLLLYARTGLLDRERSMPAMIDTGKHRAEVRRIAAGGMVLLKNEKQTLPIAHDSQAPLLVTGPGAEKVEVGGGSSRVVNGRAPVAILEGLRKTYPGRIVTAESDMKSAGTAVYCAVAPASGEGRDLESIRLAPCQEEDIIRLSQAYDRVVVIMQCGSSVEMDAWVHAPHAILVTWLSGQELGNAVGDILTGAFNPSGKLPCTFARTINDYPCEALNLWPPRLILDSVPPEPRHKKEERRILHAYDADYNEKLLVGYRWFDVRGIQPLFPFGYGLSYTSFSITDAQITREQDNFKVVCTIKNTGPVTGAETIQVYTGPTQSMETLPVRSLKAFEKVKLEAGESRKTALNLTPHAFAVYDGASEAFVASPGEYRIAVGTSSREFFLHEKVTIEKRHVYAL